MQIETHLHPAGFALYTVRAGDNEFHLSAFGGQLLDWQKNGVSILFANEEHAIHDGQTPYRGGTPICFPYFSRGALLPSETVLDPQHGLARNSVWDVEVQDDALVFRTEQPTPEGFGPTQFRAEIVYRFADDLDIQATITNIGENEAPVQFVVHSYWATDRPADARVTGLGTRYLDNLAGLAETQDSAPDAPHTPPFDRVYPDSADHLELITEAYHLEIATTGNAATVFWNPGENHPIKDLGTPNFICVESGIVTPSRHLKPSETTTLGIQYRIR